MNEQAVYQYVVQIDVTHEDMEEPYHWEMDYTRPVEPASLQWCLRQAALHAHQAWYKRPANGEDLTVIQDRTIGGHPEDRFAIRYGQEREATAQLTLQLRKQQDLPIPLIDKDERNAIVSVGVKFYGIVHVQAGKLADDPQNALIEAVEAGKYVVSKGGTVRKASIAHAYPHIPQETLDALPELIALPVFE